MRLRPDALYAYPTRSLRPLRGGHRPGRLRGRIKRNGGEILEQADQHERHLIIRELSQNVRVCTVTEVERDAPAARGRYADPR